MSIRCVTPQTPLAFSPSPPRQAAQVGFFTASAFQAQPELPHALGHLITSLHVGDVAVSADFLPTSVLSAPVFPYKKFTRLLCPSLRTFTSFGDVWTLEETPTFSSRALNPP